MADEPQAAVKDAPPGAKGGKLPGMVGPAAAVAGLLAAGIGIGVYAASLLKGVKAGEAEAKVEVKHEAGPTLESLHEVALPDLISNVRNQQGRRYIKVSCAIWVSKADAVKMGFMGGGEGGK